MATERAVPLPLANPVTPTRFDDFGRIVDPGDPTTRGAPLLMMSAPNTETFDDFGRIVAGTLPLRAAPLHVSTPIAVDDFGRIGTIPA